MMEIKKKRISDEIERMLQKQLNLELYSSDLYTAMALWADGKGVYNFRNLLKEYAEEEKGHFHLVADYLQGANACAYVEREMFKEDTNPRIYIEKDDNLGKIMLMAYNHEKKVTNTLSKIRNKARDLDDALTEVFLNKMLLEQVEEEAKWVNMYDNYSIIPEGQAEYFFDHNLPDLIKLKVV